MSFYADLHIHSKYSRATSKQADLEHMALWARKKGISVLATGDFTHPAWFAEIREKTVPAEPGLFRLRPDLQREVDQQLPPSLRGPVRFMLEVEISTIYKRAEHTRKIHHLVYAPGLQEAEEIIRCLERIGNIKSDGRPILGLDSRDLLEITMEAGDGTFLIPAHIWTPWFAVLGSKSGFDNIEDCYGELTSEIFALETGLSSDPPMNWRLSGLDRFTLVSNSDAHSPQKIAREACVFDTNMDYFAMREAMRTGNGYGGTVEFFPEEGKYHLDGHRKCEICLCPEETINFHGICPVCGKPLTVGVMHRIAELADRTEGPPPPPQSAPFRSFIPLAEIIAEIRNVGASSGKVQGIYENLTARLGSELSILAQIPREDIAHAESELLAEAIDRMRQGQVTRNAGYDGEYGVIKVFGPGELERASGVACLFEFPSEPKPPIKQTNFKTLAQALQAKQSTKKKQAKAAQPQSKETTNPPTQEGILDGLDQEQRQAAEITTGALLIVAGPGTGKTRTLTRRIAYSIADCNLPPEHFLALTFTRRAADEMRHRLEKLIPQNANKIAVMTFHSLGLLIVRENANSLGLPEDFQIATDEQRTQLLSEEMSLSLTQSNRLLKNLSRLQRCQPGKSQNSVGNEEQLQQHLSQYKKALRKKGWVDFDDLIRLPAELLETDSKLLEKYRNRYTHISIDEYQDIDEGQYRLIKCLVPPDGNVCAIGDPDQAIYGFRGANVGFFQSFHNDFPGAHAVELVTNYRSGKGIVDASVQAIAPSTLLEKRVLNAFEQNIEPIIIRECTTDRAEAEFVVHSVEKMIGGSTFFSMDSGRVAGTEETENLSFSDFAVLYRTDAQAASLIEAFARSGIPFQKYGHTSLCEDENVQALLTNIGLLPEETPLEKRLQKTVENIKGTAGVEEGSLRLIQKSLQPLARRCGTNLQKFRAELAMGVDVDLWDPRADRVSLLTLHASKGLEFRVVFLVGCESGFLPLRWGKDGETDEAEERRLFFVGMTRARERLLLSWAHRRLWRGAIQESSVSPFLQAIEEKLMEHQCSASSTKKSGPDLQQQLTLF